MRRSLGVVALSGLLAIAGTTIRAQAPASATAEKSSERDAEASVVAAERLGEQLRKHPVAPSNKAGALATFLLDTESGEVTRIADEVVPGLHYSGAVEWSHDGRRIVFDIAAGAAESGQWPRTQLASIERGEDRPLIRRLGSGCLPSVTHDGDKILFMMFRGMEDARESSFWLMDADGTGRTQIQESGRPKVAPGGRYCLITSLSSPSRFRLVELPTGLVHELQLPDRRFYSIPSWADGETLVAVTGESSGDFISLVDLSDPTRPRIKQDLWKRPDERAFKPRSPVYSAKSGRCLFLGRERDQPTAIYSIKPGEAEPPTRFEAATGNDMQGLGISPGGRYVVFSSDRPDKPTSR